MKGDVVYQNGTYQETVLEDTNGIQLVNCSEDGVNKLYRIDYEGGHEVAYQYDDAISTYEQRRARTTP